MLLVAGALLQIVLGNLAQEMFFCLEREGDLGPVWNLVFPILRLRGPVEGTLFRGTEM